LRLIASKNFNTDGEWVKGIGIKPAPGVDNPVQIYHDVEEILANIEELEKDIEQNNQISLNQPLLKSAKDRKLQSVDKFINIPNIETHWYEETWFYILFTSAGITILIVIIILFYIY
jgi:hypothetical protein